MTYLTRLQERENIVELSHNELGLIYASLKKYAQHAANSGSWNLCVEVEDLASRVAKQAEFIRAEVKAGN